MKAAKTRALNRKHAGTAKHTATAKHTPAAHKRGAAAAKQTARRTALTPKAAKARALSGGIACCCAEALAASARLAGWPVADVDVLALYRHTADSPVEGASIWRTLEAALASGLAGVRPVWFGKCPPDHTPLPFGQRLDAGDPDLGEVYHGAGDRLSHGLILGLGLPEAPHAVTLDPSGAVWSWGALYEMTAEAVIDEAWAVIWP
jgi:hypothetical protein